MNPTTQHPHYRAFRVAVATIERANPASRVRVTCAHDRIEIHDEVQPSYAAFAVMAEAITRARTSAAAAIQNV